MIWSTIIHMSSTEEVSGGLDLLICRELERYTNFSQTWMIKSLYQNNMTIEDMYRKCYDILKGTPESYLCLYTPSVDDIKAIRNHDLIWNNLESYIEEIAKRCKVFNKRFVITSLYNGIENNGDTTLVALYNQFIERYVVKNGGYIIYTSTVDKEEKARLIAKGIVEIHSGYEEWMKIKEE